MTAHARRSIAFQALLAAVAATWTAGPAAALSPPGRCEPRNPGNARILEQWNAVVQRSQDRASAHAERARCLYFLRRYQEAVSEATEAIRRDGRDAEAYLTRAKAAKMLGRKDQAVEDYTRSLAIRPTAEAHFGRGYAYLQEFRGRDQEALADFNAAIRLNPRYEEAYILRARLYGKLNEFARAVDDYTVLIRLDPQYAPNYCNMGLAQYGLGRDAEGRRYLQACYGKDPDPETRRYYEGEIQRLMAWRQAQRNASRRSGSGYFFSRSYATDSYSCSLAGGSWSNDYCY